MPNTHIRHTIKVIMHIKGTLHERKNKTNMKNFRSLIPLFHRFSFINRVGIIKLPTRQNRAKKAID